MAIYRERTLRQFTFERVSNVEVLVRDFNPLFVKTFPDKNDREPLKDLKARLADPKHNRFHLLRDEKGTAVGMELINMKDGVLYMPYASMRKDHRNSHFYPKFAAVSDQETKKDGAKIMFIDIEDPRRLENLMAGYAGEDPNAVRQNAENREHFWRRQGFYIVDDPAIKYIRASSDDPKQIQAYDNLTFRVM